MDQGIGMNQFNGCRNAMQLRRLQFQRLAGAVDQEGAHAFSPSEGGVAHGLEELARGDGDAGGGEEVAALVHYLVSPVGRFANGTAFRVDGGALSLGPFDVR